MRGWDVIAQTGLCVVLLSALGSPAAAQTSERSGADSLTGSELLEKVIAHHDPKGAWNGYSGKMHLVTTFSDGRFGQEELEIRRSEDSYRATRIVGATRATKGVRKGQCIRDVDGNSSPDEARVKQFNLTCDSAHFFKEHHTGHFGLPMALKSSGMEVDKEVGSVDFQGRKVHVLSFIGRAGAVKHPYYLGRWNLYVDPVTYALRGVRVHNADWDGYCTMAGELDVAGIRIPQVKACYRGADDAFWIVDTFTYVTEPGSK